MILCRPLTVCLSHPLPGLTVANAGAVVEALLVQDSLEKVAALPGVSVVRDIPRDHLFVCSHLKRDKRCGLIGPYLVTELRGLIKVRRLLGATLRQRKA